MALSSTDAPPSSTVPSHGIRSPASTSTKSPLRRVSAETISKPLSRCAACRRRARLVFFIPFRLSACALLRPSASASAKLANSTVNHSHRATVRGNPPLPLIKPLNIPAASSVVSRLPHQTINITGFCHCTTGESLRNASGSARRTSAGSNNRCV